jgi:hypothetical protein
MDTVESLKQIEADQLKVIKSEKLRIGILSVLILFVCCYMGWIYGFVKNELTPEKVSNDLGTAVIHQIKPMQKELTTRLVSKAQVWTESSLAEIKQSPAKLRVELQRNVENMTKPLMETFETSLSKAIEDHNEFLVKYIEERVAHDGTSDDKLELINDYVIKEFKEQALRSLNSLESGVTQQVSLVNHNLEHLLTAHDLTPQEKLQKEIIEVTLALIKVNVQGNGELRLMPDYRLVPNEAFRLFNSQTEPDHPAVIREELQRDKELRSGK